MVFTVFFVISFCVVFLPITPVTLLPGVMLLNRSTTQRDKATDIKKISRKGMVEREKPNRSLVKMGNCY